MRTVPIKVFHLSSTMEDRDGMRDWLDHVGATDYELPEGLSGCEQIIGHAAKRCYMSFEPGLNPNVNRVRKDWHKYFANINHSGHGSVLEHGTHSYGIEGVSRVFTGELNRHRAGVAISEGSMRYIRFNDVPFWMPHSLLPQDGDSPDVVEKKNKSQLVFLKAFQQDESSYLELCEIWGIEDMKDFSQKKILTSMFRRVIGMGVATGGVWTFNLRALRHIIALRTTPHAEEEISYVVSMIAKDLVSREPRIMCDFEETEAGWVPKYHKV